LPELALLDIRLPGSISGPMVGERIRKSPRLKNIAIVLITAYKLTDDEKKAVIKQAGADMLLSKPLPSQAQFKKLLEETVAARQTKAPKVPAKAATIKKATIVKSPKKVK
jgi:CheY-like chemotaxis protein